MSSDHHQPISIPPLVHHKDAEEGWFKTIQTSVLNNNGNSHSTTGSVVKQQRSARRSVYLQTEMAGHYSRYDISVTDLQEVLNWCQISCLLYRPLNRVLYLLRKTWDIMGINFNLNIPVPLLTVCLFCINFIKRSILSSVKLILPGHIIIY